VDDAVRPTRELAPSRTPVVSAHAPTDPPWSPRAPPA
jgi:hypothetical protein